MAAAVSLVLLLSPSLSAAYSGSQLSADSQVLAGIADIVGEMRPGLSVDFSFGSPGSQGYVTVNGSLLTYDTPYGVVAAPAATPCSPAELLPGVRYSAKMEGSVVEIVAVG